MGSSQSNPIKVYCFGNKDNILQEIFPKKTGQDKINSEIVEYRILQKSQSIQENETKKNINIQIEWRATLYPDITEENIDDLFDNLTKKLDIPEEYKEIENNTNFNDSTSREKSKNIIIKFGIENSNYLINYMDDIPKTHLPQIAIVTNENFDENHQGLNDNRYLSIIKNVSKKKIYEYLWEKECYYNERGTILLNIFNDKIETNNYVNIMLTGLSHSGKSTLINVLSEKLVTLESPFLESVTNNIREYKVITSSNGVFQTGIKFFDTPGLTYIKNKKRNTTEEVKYAINKKMNECKDIREDIHLIYFMLRSNPNLENYIDFFKYLIELNKQRINEGKKKIYIIFIFNGSTIEMENSLIEYFKERKLEELIEIIKDGTNDKLSFKQRYAEKKASGNKQKIKNNIVRINLIKDENSNVYGIDQLLKVTLYFLKKENPFKDPFNDVLFNKLEEYKLQLEDKLINENQRSQIEEKVNIVIKELSMKNSFLSNIGSIKDIRLKAENQCKIDLFKYILIGYLGLIAPNSELNESNNHYASEYMDLFRSIANNYKIFTDEVILQPIIEDKGIIKDFIIKYIPQNYTSINHAKVEKMANLTELKVDHEKITIDGKSIYDGLSWKSILVGMLADHYSSYIYFTEKVKKHFEKYLKDTCCIKYILRQKEIYLNIFQEIEEMQNKNYWNFKAEIFE